MIFYFLKTILILGILYLLYILLLKHIKAFKWNRIYLLSTSCLAMALPLLSNINLLHDTISPQISKPLTITLDTINVYASELQTKEENGFLVLITIYMLGLAWSVSRIILGLNYIRKIRANSKVENVTAQEVYFSDDIDSPFSFYGSIYIPEKFKCNDMLHMVIKHEKAHIQLRHSADKIYFSVLQALCWFNPFVYGYHKEIELVHEFEADEYSITEFTKDEYVEGLLKTIQYTQTPNLLAHHFFHHPLKTRITMLYTKSKNALIHKASVILAGIVICSTFLILQSYGQNKTNKDKYKYRVADKTSDTIYMETPSGNIEMRVIQKVSSDSLIYENAEEMPVFACGKMSLEDFVKDNLIYPKECAESKIEGKVVVRFVIMNDGFIESYELIQGSDKRLDKAAKDLINRFPRWTPAKINGKPVSMEMYLPIVFKL